MRVEVDSADQRVETLASTLPTFLSQNAFFFSSSVFTFFQLQPTPLGHRGSLGGRLRGGTFGRKRKNFFSYPCSLCLHPELRGKNRDDGTGQSVARNKRQSSLSWTPEYA